VLSASSPRRLLVAACKAVGQLAAAVKQLQGTEGVERLLGLLTPLLDVQQVRQGAGLNSPGAGLECWGRQAGRPGEAAVAASYAS
jgi:hypothetical protein